jgi:hypothetical protein
MPHGPHKATSGMKILARSSCRGKYFLVLENRIYKVLLSQECEEKGMLVPTGLLTFSPMKHKKHLKATGIDQISEGIAIRYGSRELELFVYRFAGEEEVEWLPGSLVSNTPSDLEHFRYRLPTLQVGVDSGEMPKTTFQEKRENYIRKLHKLQEKENSIRVGLDELKEELLKAIEKAD